MLAQGLKVWLSSYMVGSETQGLCFHREMQRLGQRWGAGRVEGIRLSAPLPCPRVETLAILGDRL